MSLDYAILSLLERRAASGYELMKSFDTSVANFWHATHPQIYRELARLELKGFVSHRRVIQRGRPNKKVFSITRAGRADLIRWLAEPAAPSPQVNDLTTLKAFSLHLLPRDQALAKIAELEAIHQPMYDMHRKIEELMREQAENGHHSDLGLYLALLRGVTYEEGYLRWCERVRRVLKAASPGQIKASRNKRARQLDAVAR